MAVPRNISAQRDFSAGEVDPDLKRDDERPEYKAGLRQASNTRILNSKKLSNRPGRRVIFLTSGRVEEIVMEGLKFYLDFGDHKLAVRDANTVQVYAELGRPWTTDTVNEIIWTVYDRVIYICFPGAQPRTLIYDPTGWTTADFAETVTPGGQKRTLFYRISPKNVTMQPAARTGAGVAVTFSAGMNLTAGYVGTRMRYCNRQVVIASVATPLTGTIDIIEPLPGSQVLTFAVDPSATYNLGDEVRGSVTNSVGIVTAINAGAKTVTVQLTTLNSSTVAGSYAQSGVRNITFNPGGNFAFTTADTVVGQAASLVPSGVGAIGNPQPLVIWDDEVMNSLRGWPASCFVDQNRLGFCNFPSVPFGIAWSWIALPNDLYVDSPPNAAIFELVPNKATVFFVQPGAESNELVFTDNGLWYIPISVTNPLVPGSVVFNVVSSDACANVQPRRVQEFIVYINAGLARVMAIIPIGAYQRPYTTRDISENHSHLIRTPIAIAAPIADATFPERYLYIVNDDGTVAVGKLATVEGMINLQGMIGWVPWSGVGTVEWISARASNVLFLVQYTLNNVRAVEQVDATTYLDVSQLYNTQPPGLPIPGGQGPLWYFKNGTAELIDNGTRMMGTYQIDNLGFIVPQGNGGEDLASPTLMVGQTWTATVEPFVPAPGPGQSVQQRMRKRRVARAVVSVKDSTGFVFARLKSGQTIPGGPALGAIVSTKRVPAWNIGDVVTDPPPLREQSYSFRPVGRDNDPRNCVIKDTPGPLIVEEYGMDTSI